MVVEAEAALLLTKAAMVAANGHVVLVEAVARETAEDGVAS